MHLSGRQRTGHQEKEAEAHAEPSSTHYDAIFHPTFFQKIVVSHGDPSGNSA